MFETSGGYYCDAHMKSGLEKQEFKSRKPTGNLCPWTGCELIKTLTRSISNVNRKEHPIFFFLLIPKLLLDGPYKIFLELEIHVCPPYTQFCKPE